MRYLVGAVALAPFVFLLLAMARRRVHVQACCAPTAPPGSAHEDSLQTAAAGDPGEGPTRADVRRA